MQKLIEFYERIKSERNKVFLAKEIGNTKINIHSDIFLYITEDKKEIKTIWGEFDPRISYSYLVYLCHYDAVTNYTNGGLELIGFYDSDYKRIEEISLGSISIVGCNVNCNFEEKKNPTFSFKLKHKDGNTHTSYRANAYYKSTCQATLDSVWAIDKFYMELWDAYVRSPRLS